MKKRLYFILAGENLFHPIFFERVINVLKDSEYEIVGVTVPKDQYKKGILNALKFQFQLWGVIGFCLIVIFTLCKTLLDKLQIKNNYSIAGVAKSHNIRYLEIEDVNSESHLNYLRNLKIDIIISSNGQIFKKPLLKLPKIACINRHTALLPKYGGVLPVFWAMYYKEKQFGVSIHLMVEKIDQGDILYQEIAPLSVTNSLFRNYILGFEMSVKAVINALTNLKQKKKVGHFYPNKRGYFTFPGPLEMRKFKREHKTVSLGELFELSNNNHIA